MVKITTEHGKFFFSDFIYLLEEQSADIDETVLKINDLTYLLLAYLTKRVTMSEEDLVKVKNKITSLQNTGGNSDSIDMEVISELLNQRESISNKIKSMQELSTEEDYLTAVGVMGYVNETVGALVEELDTSSFATKTELTNRLSSKLDKTEITNYSTKQYVDAQVITTQKFRGLVSNPFEITNPQPGDYCVKFDDGSYLFYYYINDYWYTNKTIVNDTLVSNILENVTSDDILEGSSNLYYNIDRIASVVNSMINISSITSSIVNLTETVGGIKTNKHEILTDCSRGIFVSNGEVVYEKLVRNAEQSTVDFTISSGTNLTIEGTETDVLVIDVPMDIESENSWTANIGNIFATDTKTKLQFLASNGSVIFSIESISTGTYKIATGGIVVDSFSFSKVNKISVIEGILHVEGSKVNFPTNNFSLPVRQLKISRGSGTSPINLGKLYFKNISSLKYTR